MTGPEHYREAERLAQWAGDYEEGAQPDTVHVQAGQLAQVHALLALTAATVDLDDGDLWAQVIL
jgi:hypothetical protein